MQGFFVNRMMLPIVILGMGLAGLSSCESMDAEIMDEGAFTRIYDNQKLDERFYPLDIEQTLDGGFLVYSAFIGDTVSYAWPKGHLLKTDNTGNLEWEVQLQDPYVSPVPNILQLNNNYYVICMDAVTLRPKVLQVDPASSAVTLTASLDDFTYPLYTDVSADGGILLLSYERTSRNSVLTRLNQNFSIDWEASFEVVDDAEERVISHLTRQEKQYPFLTGDVGTGNSPQHYFVNAFSNFTLSTIFVNSFSGQRTGLLNGFQYTGALSALVSTSDTSFAMAKYSGGDNYLIPKINLPVDQTLSIKDIPGEKFQELTSNAKVRAKQLTFGEMETVVFASQSTTNQLMLYVFDARNGDLLETKSFASGGPVEIANFIQTSDNGLAIALQTLVAGRFPRIEIIKVPGNQFNY